MLDFDYKVIPDPLKILLKRQDFGIAEHES